MDLPHNSSISGHHHHHHHHLPPRVYNVKGRFTVGPVPLRITPRLAGIVRQHSNFWTVRLGHDGDVVYVVFARSGHVNVSGLKTLFEFSARRAVARFERAFACKASSPFIVDNSTAAGRFYGGGGGGGGGSAANNGNSNDSRLPLNRLYRRLSPLQQQPLTVSIRPDHFPSALLRPARGQPAGTLCTCIIFPNGKYIIVGGRSRSQIDNTFREAGRLVDGIVVGG